MKVLIVSYAISFHENFNKVNIELLLDLGFDVILTANKNISNFSDKRKNDFFEYCKSRNVNYQNINIPRSPFKFVQIYRSYLSLLRIAKKEEVAYIHSHTPVGGLIARLVAKKLSLTNIYTAHGFHFYRGSSILSWLFYFPVELYLSLYTDALITINKEDYDISKKLFKTNTFYIPGVGVNLNKYKTQRNLNINDKISLLSVGELNKNKNHQFVIKLLKKSSVNFKYSIAGNGSNRKKLQNLINRLDLNEQVSLLGFVDDIPDIIQKTDIFIMPSLREGLPVAMIEAMSSGIPIVASNIRGIRDLVDEGLGGFLFDFSQSSQFDNAINRLANNTELRSNMGFYNMRKAQIYDIKNVREEMKKIYSIYFLN